MYLQREAYLKKMRVFRVSPEQVHEHMQAHALADQNVLVSKKISVVVDMMSRQSFYHKLFNGKDK